MSVILTVFAIPRQQRHRQIYTKIAQVISEICLPALVNIKSVVVKIHRVFIETPAAILQKYGQAFAVNNAYSINVVTCTSATHNWLTLSAKYKRL